jgi:hypothetical protein
MIQVDVRNNILDKNYTEVDRAIVAKLQMRCVLLYQARKDIIKIFKYIVEYEKITEPKSTVWRIL